MYNNDLLKRLVFDMLLLLLLLNFHSCTKDISDKPRCNYIFYLNKPVRMSVYRRAFVTVPLTRLM